MSGTANWPRIGGIYAPNAKTSGTWKVRVTAIQDDTVYTVLRTTHGDGEITEHSPMSRSLTTFRECFLPEDQSPLPSLIAALRAYMEPGADPVECHARAAEALKAVGEA